jgi:hypothetical protein
MKKLTLFSLFATLLLSTSCKKDDDTPVTPDGITDNGTPIVIACNIQSAPLVLTNHNTKGTGIDYIVDCSVYATKSITIEAGVTILMKSGAGFNMNAPFIANGTANQPIKIYGEQDVAGYWKSILLNSQDNGNSFNYCNISNGGGGSMNGNSDLNANVVVYNGTGVRINNSIFSKSMTYGLYCYSVNGSFKHLLEFSNNLISNCTLAPLRLVGADVTSVDNTTTYANNGQNYIRVQQGDLIGANIWRKLALPYQVMGLIAVDGDASDHLVVEAGVQIKFGTGAALMIKDYQASHMRFEGTATNPIILEGLSNSQGSWKGICFRSLNPQNLMRYTHVRDGGESAFSGNATHKGNVVLGTWGTGRCRIENCTISNSAGCGIKKVGTNDIYDDGGGNTFSNNATGDTCL